MNRLIFVFMLFLMVSCKKETDKTPTSSPVSTTEVPSLDLGKKIFEGKGPCATCHQTSQNVLGPSVIEIQSIYEQQEADMIAFLKGNLDPIVDPSQFQIMKINLEITKKMSDTELQSVVDYMYHLSEK